MAGLALSAERGIPFLSGPVIDEVGFLSPSEREDLATYIREQKALLQMQLWITDLRGESIEGLSYRAAKTWQLGSKDQDNGLLFLVAPAQKQMRIEVGRGLEGDIPDILAGRILDGVVRPRFREGKFHLGIKEALSQLVLLAAKGPASEKLRERLSKEPKPGIGFVGWFFILSLFMSILLIRSLFGRRHYLGRGHHGWYTGSSTWGSGSSWSGGSWGGGGSWSGGGGSFGGGGASSSW